MELKVIENLLEKYWEGETTRSEEKVLMDFFTNESIPSHLQKAAALFIYYSKQKAIEIKNPGFDEKSIAKINPEKYSSLLWWKIAASVLIICASVFLIYRINDKMRDEDQIVENTVSYEDPEKAYEETKKALLLISAKLNTPEKYTDEIGKINEASALFK